MKMLGIEGSGYGKFKNTSIFGAKASKLRKSIWIVYLCLIVVSTTSIAHRL